VSTRQRLSPNEIAELVGEFTVMLQATNRSAATITIYRRGVDSLETFLRERGMPVAVDAVAREHVEAFFAWMLTDAGYAPTTAKAYYDGIRQFFRWLEEEGEVAEGRNPMRKRPTAEGDRAAADVLPPTRSRRCSRGARGEPSKIAATPR
jgi:site-specific recombinase XerD